MNWDTIGFGLVCFVLGVMAGRISTRHETTRHELTIVSPPTLDRPVRWWGDEWTAYWLSVLAVASVRGPGQRGVRAYFGSEVALWDKFRVSKRHRAQLVAWLGSLGVLRVRPRQPTLWRVPRREVVRMIYEKRLHPPALSDVPPDPIVDRRRV